MKTKLIIGSRGSELALTQSRYVAGLIEAAVPDIEVKVEVFSTRGDEILSKPLAEIGGKGLFTEELEAALLEGSIDLAVHSLKDLPTEEPTGLCIAATPTRATPNDALVSAKFARLADLPPGATVGTSSLRRKAQLVAAKSGLNIVDLRGNVGTRVKRVTEGDLDAAILACAGLERIGLSDGIAEVLSPEVMLPAAGQGALGVQARADDIDLLEILAKVNDVATRAEVTAERALLAALGGGCQVPIGALAEARGDSLHLRGCVCSLDGKRLFRTEISGPLIDATTLGQQAADALLREGAEAVIADIA
jgi:hydroxymethylbilane synthase